MCGRYRVKNLQAIEAALKRIFEGAMTPYEFVQRYNMAPSQGARVAVMKPDGAHTREMRWGLVPFWEKSPKPKLAPINARSGEAFTKTMFRQAIQKRRCLIPTDGFYEWPKVETGLRQPHFYTLTAERPFFFAGIYEDEVEGLRPPTYTLFTTEPNALLTALPHERMPVILETDRARAWAEPGSISETAFLDLCRPFPAEDMQAWPVSTLVNRVSNDGPECCEPAKAEDSPPAGPDQTTFGF